MTWNLLHAARHLATVTARAVPSPARRDPLLVPERIVGWLGLDPTTVAGVDVTAEGSGTAAHARVRVRFTDERARPLTLFAKVPAQAFVARLAVELTDFTRAEVGFYRDLSAEVPVAVPACRFASWDRAGFVLLLDDLESVGARFGQLGDAFDRPRIESAIAGLARLHAAYWEDPRLGGGWDWLTPLVGPFEAATGSMAAGALVWNGLRCAGPLVPDDVAARLRTYTRRRTAITAELERGPRTLLHHDCHPGNLAVDARGAIWFTDWQLVRAGPWARDVAYLLVTALDPGDRRTWEHDLLEHYLAALRDAGGEGPGTDAARVEYRRHLVYPLEAMVATLGLRRMQPDERVRPVVARAAAAVADLDAFAAL